MTIVSLGPASGNKLTSSDKPLLDAAKTSSKSRAAGQKGPGSMHGRAHAQTVSSQQDGYYAPRKSHGDDRTRHPTSSAASTIRNGNRDTSQLVPIPSDSRMCLSFFCDGEFLVLPAVALI